jgi:thiamine biosynthesis lipoprotein
MRAATFIVALALVSHSAAAAEVQRARYLMGTVCEVAVAGPDAEAQIEAAFAEAQRVEAMLSTWVDDSELIRVNRGAEPGNELRVLLAQAEEWSKKTDGAFDPRWREKVRGPKHARGYESGAFGKGYALDRMLALTKGDALIDFGGQLTIRGTRRVSIADPEDRARPLLALTLANGSLSTSSGSEQPGHIIDPRTGEALPARGSVSVIAPDAMTADILSTALYVMGDEEGLRWADAHGVAAIFITETKLVRQSTTARAHAVELLDPNYRLKD